MRVTRRLITVELPCRVDVFSAILSAVVAGYGDDATLSDDHGDRGHRSVILVSEDVDDDDPWFAITPPPREPRGPDPGRAE